MYLCRRMKLCGYLLKHGFQYVKVVPDKYKEGYKCWLFEMSPELKNAVECYYSEIKK